MFAKKVVAAFEMAELDADELVAVVGGYSEMEVLSPSGASSGYICSLSADCNTGGRPPCNPLWW